MRLKRVANIIMGQSPEGEYLNQSKGIEFHQGKIFFGNQIIRQSDTKILSVTKIAPAYSVLLCVRAPVGKVNITDREICIGRGLAAIECRDDMSFKFLYYALQNCEDVFKREATGSTFEAVTIPTVANILIPRPPITEQKRIANYLDRICAQIDSAITNFTQQIDTLKELKARLISDTVTGKIDVRNITVPRKENIS